MWHFFFFFFIFNTTLSKSASDTFVDTKQVWCKQSLICQSSEEAMDMAVWAVKLKTLKKTKYPPRKILFEGKKNPKTNPTVINKVHPWMCYPGPLPFLPHAEPSIEPMSETQKADKGTSAMWSMLPPKGPTEDQSINPVAVLSRGIKKNKTKQFYTQ